MSYEDNGSRILKPCYPSGRRGRDPRSGRDCFRIRLPLSFRNLFTYHDVQDHVVGMLHADGADAAEVLDGLLDILFDDTVM